MDKQDTFDEQLFWCKLHAQPSINQLIIQVTIFVLKNIKQQHIMYVPMHLKFQI
jgi:hypothetical protein